MAYYGKRRRTFRRRPIRRYGKRRVGRRYGRRVSKRFRKSNGRGSCQYFKRRFWWGNWNTATQLNIIGSFDLTQLPATAKTFVSAFRMYKVSRLKFELFPIQNVNTGDTSGVQNALPTVLSVCTPTNVYAGSLQAPGTEDTYLAHPTCKMHRGNRYLKFYWKPKAEMFGSRTVNSTIATVDTFYGNKWMLVSTWSGDPASNTFDNTNFGNIFIRTSYPGLAAPTQQYRCYMTVYMKLKERNENLI